MRVLNTQQMREADRQTIDDVGIPSIVLMENAGRQAVAAMEAAFDDLTVEQGRRALRPRQQRRRRLRRGAHARAARHRSDRPSCSAASPTCRATRGPTSRSSAASA